MSGTLSIVVESAYGFDVSLWCRYGVSCSVSPPPLIRFVEPKSRTVKSMTKCDRDSPLSESGLNKGE